MVKFRVQREVEGLQNCHIKCSILRFPVKATTENVKFETNAVSSILTVTISLRYFWPLSLLRFPKLSRRIF